MKSYQTHCNLHRLVLFWKDKIYEKKKKKQMTLYTDGEKINYKYSEETIIIMKGNFLSRNRTFKKYNCFPENVFFLTSFLTKKPQQRPSSVHPKNERAFPES